jgi:hypothetical protein
VRDGDKCGSCGNPRKPHRYRHQFVEPVASDDQKLDVLEPASINEAFRALVDNAARMMLDFYRATTRRGRVEVTLEYAMFHYWLAYVNVTWPPRMEMGSVERLERMTINFSQGDLFVVCGPRGVRF